MIRRVVTGNNKDGKAVIINDGTPPVTRDYVHTPQFADSLVWHTGTVPAPADEVVAEPLVSFLPGPGETVALAVTIPPDYVYADPNWDPMAAVAENERLLPVFANLFEADNPGMHTTPTVDYIVIIDGPIVLEVDDGQTVQLQTGDVVVQNANRHGWRNPTDKPAKFLAILMGTKDSNS